jgi:glycolate oxidase
VTTNHVLGLEAVLADGSVVRLGGAAREAPGYDLRGVLIGSEGTLAIVTKATVCLLRRPEAVRTLLAVYEEMDDASAAVSSIVASGIVPAAIEMMDDVAIAAVEPTVNAGYPGDAGAVLLVEVDGLAESVQERSCWWRSTDWPSLSRSSRRRSRTSAAAFVRWRYARQPTPPSASGCGRDGRAP